MAERLNKVVILGGGTAGWMTAAALSKALPATVSIQLLESDEIGIVGVGEATIPTIHWFNDLIELDEAAFARSTKASFKLGIEFVGWTGPEDRYFHPFGQYAVPGGGQPFHQRWLKARRGGLDRPLEAFSLTTQVAHQNRFARPTGDPRSILSTLGFAWHFDAALYSRHLRTLSEARGVRRIEGKLATVERAPDDGRVTALTTQRGDRLAGELFIDCSGFRALLIEGEMAAGFEDWSHWLPCDRALAVPCERLAETTPYTRATAREAGWQWRIPLQHRIGNGYVYSSAHIEDGAAIDTLMANLDGAPLADPRPLRFKAGRRRSTWVGNVVAIGLSSGFLEPLESTSIHLIQSGIAKLLSLFPDADVDPALARRFNRLFAADMDNVKDFLILHYHANGRVGEALWDHCRTMAIPDTLAERIGHYRASGRLMLDPEDLFREASWLAVLDGQGIRAEGYSPLADTLDAAADRQALDQLAGLIARAAPTLPGHDAAIQTLIGEAAGRVAATA